MFRELTATHQDRILRHVARYTLLCYEHNDYTRQALILIGACINDRKMCEDMCRQTPKTITPIVFENSEVLSSLPNANEIHQWTEILEEELSRADVVVNMTPNIVAKFYSSKSLETRRQLLKIFVVHGIWNNSICEKILYGLNPIIDVNKTVLGNIFNSLENLNLNTKLINDEECDILLERSISELRIQNVRIVAIVHPRMNGENR